MTTPRPRPSLRVSALRSLGAAIVLGSLAASPTLAVAPDPSAVLARSAAPATVSGLTLIKSGLLQPLYVTHADDDRLFVVERTGRIRILKDTGSSWAVSTFLDLRGKVDTGHSEQGLLGLAFHPDYATNGRFYVNYTDPKGDTVIAEYRRDTEGKADPASKRLVLKVNQPFDNHNGGWIAFKGPYLYIALGDGGSGGDPYGNGQDTGTRLGKILRIDPLDPDGSGPKRYSVPADNPFVGKPGLDDIWAYGLRNPWRNSFDRETGDLWIADVGQDRYEEINRAGTGKGKNFGWDRVEGRHLYPSGALCSSNCKTLPVVEYKHRNGNCSVVGGYVSRRSGAPLEGRYLFGDTCTGRIWDIAATATTAKPGTPHDTSLVLSSFGEGADGRIYVTDLSGAVYLVNGS